MSRISLENYLQVHNRYSCLSNDIYLNKKYAELYGETFDFSYSKNGLVFKVIAIKEKIENSQFYDLQSPYGYGGIYCNSQNEDFIKEALKALKTEAFKQNIIAFFIRFHLFDENLKIYSKLLPFFTKSRETIIVNTEKGIDNIRMNYSPRIRSYVKKAREELQIKFATQKDYKDFFTLYSKTMQRNQADKFYYFSEDYFQKLFDFNESKILKASLNNEILAYASFFLCGDSNSSICLPDFKCSNSAAQSGQVSRCSFTNAAVSSLTIFSKYNGSTSRTILHSFFIIDFLQSALYQFSCSMVGNTSPVICLAI